MLKAMHMQKWQKRAKHLSVLSRAAFRSDKTQAGQFCCAPASMLSLRASTDGRMMTRGLSDAADKASVKLEKRMTKHSLAEYGTAYLHTHTLLSASI
jgi:hypothetical protein